MISHRIDLTTNGAGTDSFDAASDRMDLKVKNVTREIKG